MTAYEVALLLAWAAIVLLTLGFSSLVGRLRILESRQGVGSPLVATSRLLGESLPRVGGLNLINGKAHLLFVDKGCATCHEVIPTFNTMAASDLDENRFWVLVSATDLGWIVEQSGATVVQKVSDQRELWDQLKIPVTPFGIVVHSGRIVATQPVGSLQALRRMFNGTDHEIEIK